MKIISYKSNRYAIADDSCKVIDDAQGYGYKTAQKAYKAMYYKFKGGKQKMQDREKRKKEFFKKHDGLEQYIYDIFETRFKEIARGELTIDDILDNIKNNFGIDMPKEFIY